VDTDTFFIFLGPRIGGVVEDLVGISLWGLAWLGLVSYCERLDIK
jgi:hypothetical protein